MNDIYNYERKGNRMKDFMKERVSSIFSKRVAVVVLCTIALVKGVEPWTMACLTMLGMTYIASETMIKLKK